MRKPCTFFRKSCSRFREACRVRTNPSSFRGQPRLRAGDLSGEIVARYRLARENSMNEVQKCTGDPAVEANWQHAGMFRGGKATIGSLTPGALVWIRVRTCGLKGVMGAWSDPAQIRVV